MPLPRAPSQGFDRRLVLCEVVPRFADDVAAPRTSPYVPDAKHVVVAAAGQLLSVRAPPETADLLSVVLVGAHEPRGSAHVVIEDL